MPDRFRDYMRLMRIPGIGALSLPPVIGAITVNNLSISTTITLFIIGIFLSIFGFILNDYIDIDLDKQSKSLSGRPLVKGTITKRNSIIIMLTCLLFAWLMVFIFLFKNENLFYLSLLVLLISNLLIIIYDLYGKKLLGSDLIFALAETLFFLFGALVASTNGILSIFTWVGLIIIFSQMFYENAITGGLKDADHDYLKNVKNIASEFGVKVNADKILSIPLKFKILGVGIHLITIPFIFIPFIFYGITYEIWQIILLFFIILLALFLTIKMLSIKRFNRKKLRRMIVKNLFIRYTIIPVMLFSIINFYFMIFMIIFPLVWYIFFSLIMKEKIFEPVM